MRILAVGFISVLAVGTPALAQAQAPAATTVTVPRLITVTGAYQPASGQPAASAVVTLAVYAEATGGAPLFQETQDVTLDASGRYTVQLGATQPDGLPLALFADGQERWLGVQFAGVNEVEHTRARLTSVPYALRAADADTLGGHPASAYVLSPKATGSDAKTAADAGTGTAKDIVAGTINTLAKYVTSVDVGESAVVETGGRVGIGTTAPLDLLHVRFTNTNGGLTGLAVQNLGNTTTSYSGMLFYDQNGALGQFQGFNNVTHEYRINNIAAGASINFMTGSVSKFLVAPNGNIGIGTGSPAALLEVSNAIPGGPANMWVSSFTNAVGPYFLARRARGTAAAATAVQAGDGLSGLYGMGYGATQFGPSFTGGITIQAAQNFTDTAQGTSMTFSTTAVNSATPAVRMLLDASGHLGIGTGTTLPVSFLEVSNAASPFPTPTVTTTSSFTGTIPFGSYFIGRKARGTAAAPTAVQNGDGLAAFTGQGYGATGFGGGVTGGGMLVQAAENWSDTAQGASVAFNTTTNGTTTTLTRMAITAAGDVGIGTLSPQGSLEVVRTSSQNIYFTNYQGVASVITRKAHGTSAAPTAIQFGDGLGTFGATGHDGTGFGSVAAGIGLTAEEDWTSAAHGTALVFGATPLGTINAQTFMALTPSGHLGINTPPDGAGIPTAVDPLQVFGDIRVGTTGTNGCVKNFAGTQLTGVCASDRRYKKGITPFGPALDRVAALQPVHFYWRADEFPDQHFGDSQAYGLIAQDVERVLPELVVTHDDGYKAVDYSKLPLLTIQAVKELKAENEDLKKRVAELERLIKEMHPAGSR